MSTNALYRFDLTAEAKKIPGQKLGELLSTTKQTDCRAMCVGPDGRVWAAVVDRAAPGGGLLHLVSWQPGDKAPRDRGPIGVANPEFTKFTDDNGKPLLWHHTMRKEKDGTLTPWQPMGVCAAKDGSVYVMTIAPFTLIKFGAEQVK